MNANFSTFRIRLRPIVSMAAAAAVAFAIPGQALSQSLTYYSSAPRTIVPYPAQPIQTAPQITYYRGSDGRVYGVAAPSGYLPAPLRVAPRTTGIVIEDVRSQSAPRQEAAPIRTAPIQAAAPAAASTLNTSARAQAEESLRRFQQLQGVPQESTPAQEPEKAVRTSSEEALAVASVSDKTPASVASTASAAIPQPSAAKADGKGEQAQLPPPKSY